MSDDSIRVCSSCGCSDVYCVRSGKEFCRSCADQFTPPWIRWTVHVYNVRIQYEDSFPYCSEKTRILNISTTDPVLRRVSGSKGERHYHRKMVTRKYLESLLVCAQQDEEWALKKIEMGWRDVPLSEHSERVRVLKLALGVAS